jgi:hypothetical protein
MGVDDWLRLAEAAQLADDTPRSTFDEAVRRGEMPFVVVGGFRFFAPSDVLAWAERRRQDGQKTASVAEREVAA